MLDVHCFIHAFLCIMKDERVITVSVLECLNIPIGISMSWSWSGSRSRSRVTRALNFNGIFSFFPSTACISLSFSRSSFHIPLFILDDGRIRKKY